jgi:uncharacterized membrane protein
MSIELKSPATHRISSIDFVRGIIMVIMALDHVRDYFHADAFVFDPTDMTRTNPALFFTRWITHFCAPTFVFLSGISIYLNLQRKFKKELSVFLATRGIWLIFLDLVIIRFGFFFNFFYDMTILNVLWVFGAAMLMMAALIWLSQWLLLVLSVVIIIGQHFLPLSIPGLTTRAILPLSSTMTIIIAYPLLQWLAIMMLGYFIGKMYDGHIPKIVRQRRLIIVGIAALTLFVIIRLINVYGDPAPWSSQKNIMFTIMSFLNTSKYPPSFLFFLMTLGPIFILLAITENIRINALKFFYIFGRVPLFYFILHFYLAHTLALVFYLAKTGKSFAELDMHFNKSFGGITPEGGHSLAWVFVAWIAVVLICYPVCKWFSDYKATHKKWWLSYL